MKKHNESKSIKGIRRSKGKILCKVISFTMIFVMLFCISASAEMTTITVKDQDGNIVNIETDITIYEEEINSTILTRKYLHIDYESYKYTRYQLIMVGGGVQNNLTAFVEKAGDDILIYYQEPISNKNYANKITDDNGDTIISIQDGATALQVYAKWEEIIEPLQNNDFSEYITVYTEPPVYEGFIGNARGLFDMLFESIQSIFNWLVSPNVIVFFGLGIILSLTTICILISKRFFWGR